MSQVFDMVIWLRRGPLGAVEKAKPSCNGEVVLVTDWPMIGVGNGGRFVVFDIPKDAQGGFRDQYGAQLTWPYEDE